ncbi:Transcription factor ili4, partial [Sarracenia purpurea var. burkii]
VPAATSNILKETCSYIRKLHREVDGLSERLSQLLAAMDSGGVHADILRSLLQQ